MSTDPDNGRAATDTDRPTVAHVLHRLDFAGAEVLAAELSRRQGDRYRFVFLCLDDVGELGRQLAGEGYAVLDLKRRPGVDLAVSKRIHHAVREHRIDLLHAHQYTPFFYAATSRGMSLKPPVLFTEHGRHYPDVRRRKRLIANQLLLRRFDRVTAVGTFVKEALVENEGIAPERIEVIYNGIDPARFNEAAVGDVRRKLGIAPDQPVVLQVARFHEVKDHPTALRAFAETVRQVPNAVLLLAGDGNERPAIESLVCELDLDIHVRLLGMRDDVPALMRAADVFMLSSLSEGVSLTLLEAMGAKLPIAATDVGGNNEVVVHEQTGLLSPRQDAAALADSLVRLLTDPALRRRFGDGGHQRLLQRFGQQRMHQRYVRCYEQMLQRVAGHPQRAVRALAG